MTEKLSERLRERLSLGNCRQDGKFYPNNSEQKLIDEVEAFESELERLGKKHQETIGFLDESEKDIDVLKVENQRLQNELDEYVESSRAGSSTEADYIEDLEDRLRRAMELMKQFPKLSAEFNSGGECERVYYDEDRIDRWLEELDSALRGKLPQVKPE